MRGITAWVLALWVLGATALFFAQPYVWQALSTEARSAGSVLRMLFGGG